MDFSLGLFDEFDQYNKIDFENEKLGAFLNADSSKVIRSTALIDSTGDYVYIDSIYVYDPSNTYNDFPRYQVRFIIDPAGSYVREISDNNKMFYKYVSDPPTYNSKELYSPYRTIFAPNDHQFGKAHISQA